MRAGALSLWERHEAVPTLLAVHTSSPGCLLIPVSRTNREMDIMGYQCLEPELRWIAKHRPVPNFGPEFMNMKEAARYLQTTSENIKGLVNEKILIRLPREYGGSKISAQVRDFGSASSVLNQCRGALEAMATLSSHR